PAPLRARLAAFAASHADAKLPLPDDLARWANATFPVDVRGVNAEWSEEDAYVALPRPGGDAWLRIGADGQAEYEKTDRGWISWLNDMHKGRNAGAVWSWFIDIFAGACLVFCMTGFLILKFHAANRPSTWPVIGFGIVLPIVLALLFVH
ncbi:MAG: PepSY-associated TM helix domain-containing protein, partial [Telluria sp.]